MERQLVKQLSIATDIGPLILTEQDDCLTAITGGGGPASQATPLLQEAADQLQAYLRGDLRDFSIPLRPRGTAFQCRIWDLMRQIPFGKTWSYGDMADRAGTAARAVGNACSANPILILIPCHRVMGKAGPTGYSGPGGLDTKRFLIALEQRRTVIQTTIQTAIQTEFAFRRSA